MDRTWLSCSRGGGTRFAVRHASHPDQNESSIASRHRESRRLAACRQAPSRRHAELRDAHNTARAGRASNACRTWRTAPLCSWRRTAACHRGGGLQSGATARGRSRASSWTRRGAPRGQTAPRKSLRAVCEAGGPDPARGCSYDRRGWGSAAETASAPTRAAVRRQPQGRR